MSQPVAWHNGTASYNGHSPHLLAANHANNAMLDDGNAELCFDEDPNSCNPGYNYDFNPAQSYDQDVHHESKKQYFSRGMPPTEFLHPPMSGQHYHPAQQNPDCFMDCSMAPKNTHLTNAQMTNIDTTYYGNSNVNGQFQNAAMQYANLEKSIDYNDSVEDPEGEVPSKDALLHTLNGKKQKRGKYQLSKTVEMKIAEASAVPDERYVPKPGRKRKSKEPVTDEQREKNNAATRKCNKKKKLLLDDHVNNCPGRDKAFVDLKAEYALLLEKYNFQKKQLDFYQTNCHC